MKLSEVPVGTVYSTTEGKELYFKLNDYFSVAVYLRKTRQETLLVLGKGIAFEHVVSTIVSQMLVFNEEQPRQPPHKLPQPIVKTYTVNWDSCRYSVSDFNGEWLFTKFEISKAIALRFGSLQFPEATPWIVRKALIFKVKINQFDVSD